MATLNLGRIKPVFKGAYSGSTAYVVDDIVTHGDESFICIQAHGAGTQATSVTAYWTKLAAKGSDGTDVGATLTTQGDILYRDGSGLARLGFGTSGLFLKTQGTGANPVWAAAGGSFENNLFHIVHETADGTAGSGTNANSWDDRILNTIKVNQISGTLASNVIGLGAGDYFIDGGMFFTNSGYVQGRLYDTTNSTTLVVGNNTYTEGYAGSWNEVQGKFTLSGATDMSVQYYCTTAYGTNGQGFASPSSGEVNRYADIKIWKL